MPPEIPSQFRFEVLLSHTFPGFFSALSAFMLLDVLSSSDLSSLAFGSITDFLSVMGFIILLGTIFGVVIDGVHHWVIEDHIFKKCLEYDKLEKERESLYPSSDIKHFYYFTRIGEDAFNYLADNYYRYSEFYANIFISLIPFSIISPFYLCRILKISCWWSIILGSGVPLVLAGLCLWSGYDAFITYTRHRRDLIYGFLRITRYVEVTADPDSIEITSSPSPKCSKITAQLMVWKLRELEESDLEKLLNKEALHGADLKNLWNNEELKKLRVWKRSESPLEGININFETTLGHLSNNHKETDENGEATVQLSSEEPGIAIVTASAEGFISGNVEVEVKEKKKK